MKSTIKKLMATLSALTLMTTMSVTAFAAEDTKTSSNDVAVEAMAAGNGSGYSIAPFSYYDPDSFTFSNRNVGNTRWYDGGHMAAEITASSETTGLKIHVTAHIIGKGSVSWDVPVDGRMHKKDWISLGTSSGRNVYFEYSCDQNTAASITVHNKSYSW